MRRLFIWMSENDGLNDLVTTWTPARRLARRFAAGEKLDEALAVTDGLNRRGFHVTLDHLGEEVDEVEDASRAVEDYLECLRAIERAALDATLSVKLTQLGLSFDPALAETNLRRLIGEAEAKDNFVRIDMEGSAYTDATLRIFHSAYRDHETVGIAIQSCLRRSGGDVASLASVGAPVRLVKGAYDEPPAVAFQEKAEVDKNFVRLMEMLVDAGVPTAIATHDDRMIDATLDYLSRNGHSGRDVEFQMLYGVRRNLQARLLDDGHPVRIYVPFGADWFPYLMRRIAERPANALFVLRAMIGS